MSEHYDYDVVIIGAGIGGLVCGCYLAKAGFKTLIVEKNAKPGGYCSSFSRHGYHFDACAHALGSLRPGGRLDKLFKDLDLYERLQIIRKDPSDIIFTPTHKISIHNSIAKTIQEFQQAFPKESKQIAKFIQYATSNDSIEFIKLRSKTLQELLDEFFEDKILKTILSLFILGFVGCPPDDVSAVIACIVFREFVFDGGYVPVGGMQEFPDALMSKFNEFGGSSTMLSPVKKLIFKDNCANGVVLKNGEKIFSKYVVCACDLRHVLFDLIGKEILPFDLENKVLKREHSLSSFLVYLGMDEHYELIPEQMSNIWVMDNDNIDSIYSNMVKHRNDCVLATTSTNENKKVSIRIESTVSCKTGEFWSEIRCKELSKRFIDLAGKKLPNLSKNIRFEFSASPKTLNKWTNNYLGASYGWLSVPGQLGDPDFSQKTAINNLFLTGHWSNQSSGIAFVANCGYETAKIIRNFKK